MENKLLTKLSLPIDLYTCIFSFSLGFFSDFMIFFHRQIYQQKEQIPPTLKKLPTSKLI